MRKGRKPGAAGQYLRFVQERAERSIFLPHALSDSLSAKGAKLLAASGSFGSCGGVGSAVGGDFVMCLVASGTLTLACRRCANRVEGKDVAARGKCGCGVVASSGYA